MYIETNQKIINTSYNIFIQQKPRYKLSPNTSC